MIYIEDNLPDIRTNGLNTNEAVSFGSTLSVTGATTIGGALAVTGSITGPRVSSIISSATTGATVVLTAAQSGSKCINVSTGGSPSWTLPTAAAGLTFTFICENTTAGFTVTGGPIKAKTSATGTAISGTTLTNTQATAVVGDAITLICDGTNWLMESQSGIFAAA